MHYWRSVIVGVVSVLCIFTCSVCLFLWSKDSCPLGTFTCTTGGVCVPQQRVCNNHNDCPNGEDEDPVLCSDLNGSVNMINNLYNTSFSDVSVSKKMLNVCEVADYPPGCLCKYSWRIFCKNMGLFEVPRDISSGVTHLILANNSITRLGRGALNGYDLQVLHLEGNGLEGLEPGVFEGQAGLKRLLLMHNNLTRIPEGVFRGLGKLLWLFLDNNAIAEVFFEDFADLESLEWLNLSYNELTLANVSLPAMLRLLEAFFDGNSIARVDKWTFWRLSNLELLSLRKNRISHIHPEAFASLTSLRELDLFENQLTRLAPDVFGALLLLNKMYLGRNPFEIIPGELFKNLSNLASLNMDGIEIDNIDVSMFSHLRSLESVYFKKYKYCSYAPMVPRCRPLSDGVSSTRQLLKRPLMRYVTWFICAATCFGNVLVVCGRFVFKDENKVLSVIIRNLAASDFLMGVYLLIIAVHDVMYRDNYNREAYKWISSWTCTATGMVAMVSSEVSVLLLVFMSMERFLLIAMPFGRYSSVSMKEAALILAFIWLIGIGIATVPVMELYSSTRFYGVNGLCFPLHIDDPYMLGWKYSALIFFGINATSLCLIASVYLAMFVSIFKTRNATSLPIKDYEFALRFFFIVITDVSCWLPIIAAKMAACGGADISADLYAWLIIFILPINSALNPLIYTFTTPKYRRKMRATAGSDLINAYSKEEFRKPRKHSAQSTVDTGSIPLASYSAQSLNVRVVVDKF